MSSPSLEEVAAQVGGQEAEQDEEDESKGCSDRTAVNGDGKNREPGVGPRELHLPGQRFDEHVPGDAFLTAHAILQRAVNHPFQAHAEAAWLQRRQALARCYYPHLAWPRPRSSQGTALRVQRTKQCKQARFSVLAMVTLSL